jgi:putative spermidine/putrescine transport system ATP-binding protein
MSDRIALMDGGRIAQLGSAEDLYERPRSRFVAEFIGESNLLDGRAERGRFTTSLGLSVPIAATAPAGDALLVLRPEKAALVPAAQTDGVPGPDAAGIPGIVHELVYVGEFTRYRVALDGSATLTVKMPNGRAAFRPEIGTRVRVLWQPGDECIIPRTHDGGTR